MANDFVESEDGLPDDSIVQLQTDIADRLATLSQQSDTPDEFEHSGGSFVADDVDFASSSWMARLAEVQDWLRLGYALPLDSPASFIQALASALGFENSDAAAVFSTGQPSLTVSGLGRLFDRADQATRIQQVFVEQLEETGSVKAASDAWKEAWEDEPEPDEEEPLEPVSATTEVWPIQNFTDSDLNLTPSYQRGDVWTTSARQLLIESILRGIPLPSVILLKPDQPGRPYEVVDGKQRLTAILRFVGKHPLAVDRVRKADDVHEQHGELVKAFEGNYPHFKKMWKALEHQSITSKIEDDFFFPFKLGSNDAVFNGALAELKGKYFTQIINHVISVADEQRTVGEVFRKVVAYKIPVIEYKKATQGQIHEVFKLYNKQGVHLNAEEIRNAIYHEVELTRAMLVAAGDSPVHTVEDVESIAPSLANVWADISHLGSTLEGYGFGESRYRRTKVLSWVLATVLGDTGGKDLPSTARHIDDLLKKAKGTFDKIGATPPLNNPKLSDPAVLASLFKSIAASAKLHKVFEDELWAKTFRDGDAGQKWQELQLIGSLVGIVIAYLGDPGTAEDRIEEHAEEIYAESATAERGEQQSLWARPNKTQTKTQWEFIAKVAKRVAELLETDTAAASDAIRRKFGSSGVESLFAMIANDGQ
ncbi:DUF262 domain-containing protein [Cryocola sp. 340MFSha3.1]|uniref:DUF262 domain-containing protein n=1 Tax=Cryocola sp. 340MFSha3.1 TaxID=1169145 RepID=UPI00035D20AB|nr:DUF262 domain-containing protein [Cryocola sp. 340MFSha3.1]